MRVRDPLVIKFTNLDWTTENHATVVKISYSGNSQGLTTGFLWLIFKTRWTIISPVHVFDTELFGFLVFAIQYKFSFFE